MQLPKLYHHQSQHSHKLKFTYWHIRARSVLPIVAMHKGKIEYEWDGANDWPAQKDKCPFGQLPLLEDGDIRVGQSLAIARYIGRKGGLLGLDSDADYAASEQLVQQFEDILTDIGKAHNSKPRAEAMKKALDESVAQKLAAVEKICKGHTITGKILLGDLAIFSALYIIVHDLRPNYLEQFPKLKAAYEHILADPDVKTIEKVQWGQWYKAVDDPQ